MSALEIPFPPRHEPFAGGRMDPPLVAVQPGWEYRDIVRDPAEPLSEAELNRLGAERWELAGVLASGSQVHYYLKRERPLRSLWRAVPRPASCNRYLECRRRPPGLRPGARRVAGSSGERL